MNSLRFDKIGYMSRLWALAPPLLYGALIATISSIPGPSFPPVASKLFQFDKAVHFAAFGLLSMMCVWSSRRLGAPALRAVLIAMLATAAWGALDELHQRWVPGRSSDPFDFVADVAGGVVGAILAILLIRSRRNRFQPQKGDVKAT